MTQEEKDLLIMDLSARLPYDVLMTNKRSCRRYYPLTYEDLEDATFDEDWDDMPYLRSMQSMTKKEKKEYAAFIYSDSITVKSMADLIDWLNSHYFDYRGLIEKGLALEAKAGTYTIKKNKV